MFVCKAVCMKGGQTGKLPDFIYLQTKNESKNFAISGVNL